MSILETIVDTLNHLVWSVPEQLPWLVALLLGAGIWVTFRLGFLQLRQVGHALKVVRGEFDDPAHKGDINHFQALSTALSATVGIGNIAGVAVAIHLGGPGAIFWMWLTAFFGMALKYAECTLSMLYRDFDERGNAAGGPMYYIEKGLGRRWKPLAVFFAGCTVVASFGGGNMNQSNTVAVSARADFGANEVLVGIITAVLVGSVILGGIKRIGKVSSKLAPTMAAIYVLAALAVIFRHIGEVPAALATIVHDAFNPAASLGGSVAGTIMVTLVWGVKRGLFSNEAGQGSAPIAHAAAKTDEPVREGVVAMIGPLIDTLIICTMTALVIIITGVWDEKHAVQLRLDEVEIAPGIHQTSPQTPAHQALAQAREAIAAHRASGNSTVNFPVKNGVPLAVAFIAVDGFVDDVRILDSEDQPVTGTVRVTVADHTATVDNVPATITLAGRALQTSSALTAVAFRKGLSFLGDWGSYVVTLSVFLFALSTMISWSYYGDRAIVYLVGYKGVLYYRLAFVLFVFLGAWLSLEVVWSYGDLALGLMTVPNLIAVILLTRTVRQRTDEYLGRMEAGAETAP